MSKISTSSRSIIRGRIVGVDPDGDVRNPPSEVSSIIDVPEYATTKTTIVNAPITPPTIILGFNVFFELVLLLNVKIKNPYTAILQNNHAIFSGCPRGKNSIE